MNSRDVSLILVVLVLIGAFSTFVTVLPQAAKATTHFVGGGGPGNFTMIQSAVDFAIRGDFVYVYPGVYVENVLIQKSLSLIGEDKDSTTVDGNGLGDTIRVTSNWVNITGFTVTNAGLNPVDAGIELDHVQHCNIINNNASANRFKGISIDNSDNNTVTNNTVSLNGRIGILFHFSHNNTITDNIASQNNGSGLVLAWSNNNTLRFNIALDNRDAGIGLTGHPSLGGFSNVVSHNLASDNMDGIFVGGLMDEISNNTATYNLNGMTFSGGFYNYVKDNDISSNTGEGIFFTSAVSYNTIQSNMISNNGANGVYIEPVMTENNTIIDNDIHNNSFSGILASELYYQDIGGNRILNNGGDGIAVLTSNLNNHISNNTISFNIGAGIYFGPPVVSSGNVIADNSISFNFGPGVTIMTSSNNTITANEITSNTNDGISLMMSEGSVVSGNTVIENHVGIVLEMLSVDNSITGNTVSQSHATGIELMDSLSNAIVGNEVSYNLIGIRLSSSSGNGIYHNNIINNSIQAVDDSFDNYWDDGYPSGGNYWSDYAGDDQLSGPDQDQPGSDGIGDTPYVIDLDSQDRYPLLNTTTPIRPPRNIGAYLCSPGFVDVTITWDLSPDDGPGTHPVLRYDVYRNESYDPHGVGYSLLASVVSGTTSFVDTGAGEGDPLNHFYFVCAVDNRGESACTDNQAGKFSRPLSAGPNLVSIPLLQSNVGIESVFQTVMFDKAWRYDAFTEHWKSFATFKPYKGELTTLDPIMGIWINVTSDSNLTVAGVVPEYSVILLQKGWNLVGFPCFKDYNVGLVKVVVPMERMEGYDALVPPYFLRLMTDGDDLEAGNGYWIMAEIDSLWPLDNL